MSTDLSDSPTSLLDPSINWVETGDTGAESPTAVTPSTDEGPDTSHVGPGDTAGATPDAGAQSRAGADGATPSPPGDVPYERHKAVLEAQRAESDAKWQRVAWAEELQKAGKTPDQIREALDIYDRVDGDPVGFLGRFYQQLENHPVYAQQVRSEIARILGGRGRTANAEPEGDPEPQPDYTGQDAQGREIPVYSPQQQRKWGEWKARQEQAARDAEIGPIRQYVEQQRTLAAVQQIVAGEEKAALDEVAEFRKKPHFSEHEKGFINDWMKERHYRAPLAHAYIALLTEKVMPSLSQTAKTQLMTELKTQAAAGTSVNPRAGAAATPKAPTGFRDPSLDWS